MNKTFTELCDELKLVEGNWSAPNEANQPFKLSDTIPLDKRTVDVTLELFERTGE